MALTVVSANRTSGWCMLAATMLWAYASFAAEVGPFLNKPQKGHTAVRCVGATSVCKSLHDAACASASLRRYYLNISSVSYSCSGSNCHLTSIRRTALNWGGPIPHCVNQSLHQIPAQVQPAGKYASLHQQSSESRCNSHHWL